MFYTDVNNRYYCDNNKDDSTITKHTIIRIKVYTAIKMHELCHAEQKVHIMEMFSVFNYKNISVKTKTILKAITQMTI